MNNHTVGKLQRNKSDGVTKKLGLNDPLSREVRSKLNDRLSSIYVGPYRQLADLCLDSSRVFDELMLSLSQGDIDADFLSIKKELEYASFFRKMSVPESPYLPTEHECFKSWREFDESLSNLDMYFEHLECWPYEEKFFLIKAKYLIAEILGAAPSHHDIAKASFPGPGATRGRLKGWNDPFTKYSELLSGRATYYQEGIIVLEKYVAALIDEHRFVRREMAKRYPPFVRQRDSYKEFRNRCIKYILYSHPDQVVQGNKFCTVPKTAKSLRPICVEADVNMILQRGLGEIIRRRLGKVGITLDYQAEYHKYLVENHWTDICTIDLSSASDSIHYGLVKYLLPPGWFVHIDNLRANATEFEGEIHTLNKISSMGNGFTFELESLIFYALMRSLGDDQLLPSWKRGSQESYTGLYTTVFGDDIILPLKQYDKAISVLTFCGFSVNQQKSHGARSRMRESCGAYVLDGQPLQLLTFKELETVCDLLSIRNRLFRSGQMKYSSLFDVVDSLLITELLRRRIQPSRLYYDGKQLGDTQVLYVSKQGKPDKRLQKILCRVMEHNVPDTFACLKTALYCRNGTEPMLTNSLYEHFYLVRRR